MACKENQLSVLNEDHAPPKTKNLILKKPQQKVASKDKNKGSLEVEYL